jgi:hypothetical protein
MKKLSNRSIIILKEKHKKSNNFLTSKPMFYFRLQFFLNNILWKTSLANNSILSYSNSDINLDIIQIVSYPK